MLVQKEYQMFTKGRNKGTYKFTLNPCNGAQKVCLAGDFNNWEPVKMRKQKNGGYGLTIKLDPGDYQYKFQVDDEWLLDPENQDNALNPFGSLNSLAKVL